ncbi:hypothetical protein VTK56DRAFT_8616 [Thermocarpiscus australiensis]
MADASRALKQPSTTKKQSVSSLGAKMDRRAIGQAEYIRSSLQEEIRDFEDSFDEILQTANAFLVATEKIAQSPSLVIVDDDAVVKNICRFLASSNTILDFLDFQNQMTGLPSGGDTSLEKQVKAAQALVAELISALLLHKKAESYPGKELGMVYNEDVKFFGGFVLHKNENADHCDVPDQVEENFDLGKQRQYWHPESIYHPLRHVPGTQWHKFFGNIRPGPVMSPELFRERKPLPSFTVIFPKTITWVGHEVFTNYETNRQLFERNGRLPGPRRSDHLMIRRIQRRLSTLFQGWKRDLSDKIYYVEDLSVLPRPEYDIMGFSRLEALNAEINAPELAGIALMGEDIPELPVYLKGEPTKYCIDSDDDGSD